MNTGVENSFGVLFIQIKVQFDKGLCGETSVTKQDGVFGHAQFKGVLKIKMNFGVNYEKVKGYL